jgi:hypothetical protein
MKLTETEKDLILHAVRAFKERFGPLGADPKLTRYADYAKELVFAEPKILRGTMPDNVRQSIAVTVAVEWYAQNTPDPAKELLDLLSALQAFTVSHEFRD